MAAGAEQLPATSSDGFQMHPLATGRLGDNTRPIVFLDSDDEDEKIDPIVRPSGPASTEQKRKRPTPEAEPVDPLSDFLSQVLDIVPDIEVAHAESLIAVRAESAGLEGLVEAVLATIFEKDYPKQTRIKASIAPDLLKDLDASLDEEGEYKDIGNDYLSGQWRKEERSGRGYLKNSLQALEQAFAWMPSSFIRATYYQHQFYTPTYRILEAATKRDPLPYTQLERARSKPKGKGKGTERDQDDGGSSKRVRFDPKVDQGSEEFENEKQWWDALRLRKQTFHEEKEKRETETKRGIEAGEGLPCGCCFDDYLWDDMVQCAEGHLFCKDCARAYVQTKLGDQNTTITCMSSEGDGCQSLIPDSEITRVLPSKALELYDRLKQAKEIEQAKLAGLENCPNCPWACVIEDDNEKLFRCGNEQCGNVTCRKCQRPDHIPKTCEEVEADHRLNNRHAVEEAMSEAFMRKCPQCAKAFIKVDGCNKITCTNCKALSCYICREVVKDGYAHFTKAGSTCSLHDQPSNTEEVGRARERAQEEARAKAAAAGVQLDDKDLDVEMPDEDPRIAADALRRRYAQQAMAADALRRNGGIRGQAAPAPVDPVGPMDPMARRLQAGVAFIYAREAQAAARAAGEALPADAQEILRLAEQEMEQEAEELFALEQARGVAAAQAARADGPADGWAGPIRSAREALAAHGMVEAHAAMLRQRAAQADGGVPQAGGQVPPALVERFLERFRQVVNDRDAVRDRAMASVGHRTIAGGLTPEQAIAAAEEQRDRFNVVRRPIPEQYARFLTQPNRDYLRLVDAVERAHRQLQQAGLIPAPPPVAHYGRLPLLPLGPVVRAAAPMLRARAQAGGPRGPVWQRPEDPRVAGPGPGRVRFADAAPMEIDG